MFTQDFILGGHCRHLQAWLCHLSSSEWKKDEKKTKSHWSSNSVIELELALVNLVNMFPPHKEACTCILHSTYSCTYSQQISNRKSFYKVTQTKHSISLSTYCTCPTSVPTYLTDLYINYELCDYKNNCFFTLQRQYLILYKPQKNFFYYWNLLGELNGINMLSSHTLV